MKRLALILCLLVTPAFAQQARQPDTIDQRIGAQIGALVIQSTGLQMQLEQAQEALKTAQDRVKALEDKYEPKKVGDAK